MQSQRQELENETEEFERERENQKKTTSNPQREKNHKTDLRPTEARKTEQDNQKEGEREAIDI